MNDRIGKLLMQWRINQVMPHLSGMLLDIGCGTNELVRQYAGKGIGVDVFQWGSVDCVVDNTAVLPFENKSFDTITIIAALNHIPNRVDVLRETNRLLRPEGRLIITMIPPRISAIWHTIRAPWDADQQERGMKEGEVFGLTAKEIGQTLQQTGYIVTRESRFMLGINSMTIAQPKSNH